LTGRGGRCQSVFKPSVHYLNHREGTWIRH
jgi:hypothetical protein